MKKYIFFTLMMTVSMAFANPISRQQARQNAAAFLNKRQNPKGKLNLKLAHQRLFENHDPGQADRDTALYVFNIGADEGFIITSGDDAAKQVLGFSEKGHFDPGRIPENMKSWMDGCLKEMEWLRKHSKESNGKNTSQTATRNKISPLLVTQWDQASPYNAMCPSYGIGIHFFTGCVTTAMAQIMNYYKWPAATKEKIESYSMTVDGYDITLDEIPAHTPIDWEHMKNYYYKNDIIFNPTYVKAVAELMIYCATAIKAEFRINATSAYTKDAAEKLIKKFGYSPDVKEVLRSEYSVSKWLELIYNELKEGRPVIYGGENSISGHAFVVDGYEGDEYFHINWGWGGDCDGNFILTVADPYANAIWYFGSSENGYSRNQHAVINIRPENGTSVETEPAGLTFKKTTVNGNIISFDIIQNLSGSTNSFEYTVATMDDDGTLTPVADIRSVKDLKHSNDITNISFTVTGLSDGTHKIVPVSRVIGTNKWIYNFSGAAEEYVEARVIGGKITLYVHQPSYILNVAGFSFPGSLKKSQTQPVKVEIINLGDEYYGDIYLFASKTSSKGKANGPFGISVTKGGRTEATLSFTPQSDGKYNVWVTTDKAGDQVIGQSSVNIKPNDDTELKLTMSINNLDEEKKHLLGSTIEAKIMYENPTSDNYSGQIGFRVYCYGDGGVKILSNGEEKKISAGASGIINASMEIDLPNEYKEFAVVPFHISGDQAVEAEGYKDTRYTIIPALPYYTGEGEKIMMATYDKLTVTDDMAAVDLRKNTTITSIAVENTNCLFITDSESTPIPGLAGNVVKDGVAEEVVLHDGHPFYSPVDFVAKKISYTRVFDKGTNGIGGWDTIVLPFDVQKVTVEKNGKDYQIDWFRFENDRYKNFWVKEFHNDSQKTMYYSMTQEMAALRPYLIAVPGHYWGENNDLTGKPVTFSGENVSVSSDNIASTTGDFYKMKGVFTKTPLENIYFLNEGGTSFVRGDTTIFPFRAFITTTTTGPVSYETAVNIGSSDVDHIDNIQMDTTDNWYTVTGVRIGKPTKSGLYISRGKKIFLAR